MHVQGSLLLDGRPAAGGRVLALSADMTRVLGGAETSAGGRYEIDIPGEAAAMLMARLRGPLLAAAVQEAHADGTPNDFRFDSQSPLFCTLRGEIVFGRGAAAPFVEINLTPAHLHGVPAAVEQFFLRRDVGVVDAAFYDALIREKKFTLRVQRGAWRIAGGCIDYGRPTTTGHPPPNVIVERIETGDGRTLPGEPFAGFTLDVSGDAAIKLHVGILPDERLGAP